MKALVLSSTYPDPTRPTHGVFVQERLRALSRRAELQVLAPTPWFRKWKGGVPRREERAGMPTEHPTYYYIPRFFKGLDGLGLFLSSCRTARRMAKPGIDLIDAHFAWPDGFAAILMGKMLRKPVVITLRGTLVWLFNDPIRRRLMGWALRRADRIVAVSTELAEHAVKLGVERDRIQVVSNGVDCKQYQPADRDAARAELELSSTGPLLVSVGNLSPRKGFQRVIAAMPGLLAAHPNLRLVVVGGGGAEGDNSVELEQRISELGLAERVVLAGAQPPERVVRYLAAADLFVLSSSYEGSPNVVLEAMASGRPVVVSRVGEVEAMVPKHCGRLYGPAEDVPALEAALATALGRDWDEKGIRAYAETQTWDGVADRVLHSWQAAVENHPRSRKDAAGNLVPPLTAGHDGNDR
jgi:teichuronic acid biosynthesis glycosyltransferase TuaC